MKTTLIKDINSELSLFLAKAYENVESIDYLKSTTIEKTIGINVGGSYEKIPHIVAVDLFHSIMTVSGYTTGVKVGKARFGKQPYRDGNTIFINIIIEISN